MLKYTAEDFDSVGFVPVHKLCFQAAKVAQNIANNYNAQYAKNVRDLEEKLQILQEQNEKLQEELKSARSLTDLSINGGPF